MQRRLWLGVSIAVLLVAAACYVVLHPAWRYEGDGTIYDAGVVSYPRFRVEFQPMIFTERSTRSFTFTRFPGNPATVLVRTPTAPDPEPLERLVTRVGVQIKSQEGKLLCSGSGFPAGRNDEQLLVISSAHAALGLWHMGCNGVDVRACDPCTLEISISEVDPATPPIPLVPTLQGGGIELT